MKYSLGRVIEHSHIKEEDGTIHYINVPGLDFVTLCGITDWIGAPKYGTETRKPVTCKGCLAIVRYVQGSRKEKI